MNHIKNHNDERHILLKFFYEKLIEGNDSYRRDTDATGLHIPKGSNLESATLLACHERSLDTSTSLKNLLAGDKQQTPTLKIKITIPKNCQKVNKEVNRVTANTAPVPTSTKISVDPAASQIFSTICTNPQCV